MYPLLVWKNGEWEGRWRGGLEEGWEGWGKEEIQGREGLGEDTDTNRKYLN